MLPTALRSTRKEVSLVRSAWNCQATSPSWLSVHLVVGHLCTWMLAITRLLDICAPGCWTSVHLVVYLCTLLLDIHATGCWTSVLFVVGHLCTWLLDSRAPGCWTLGTRLLDICVPGWWTSVLFIVGYLCTWLLDIGASRKWSKHISNHLLHLSLNNNMS